MKAYEGKKFAFIRAIYWLLTPYTKNEGKLNFKQKISLRFIALGTVMYTIATQRSKKPVRHLNHPNAIL